MIPNDGNRWDSGEPPATAAIPRYPQNLREKYHPARWDLRRITTRWNDDRNRILGDETAVTLLVVDCRNSECAPHVASYSVTDDESLNQALDQGRDLSRVVRGEDAHAHAFYLSPSYSFGPLQIAPHHLDTLLTRLLVFPAFLEILHLFGTKTRERDEDYAVYHQGMAGTKTKEREEDYAVYHQGMAGTKDPVQKDAQVQKSFEICYNFRYVAQRRRLGESVMWTTRKMGLYSQYVPTTRMSTWISVFAPEECMERVQEVLALAPEKTWDGTPKKRHNLDIHLLFMRTASHNWLPYINDLDSDFTDMNQKAYLWRPKPGDPIVANRDTELELPDTQRVEMFKVRVLETLRALDVNIANIESLRRGVAIFRRKAPDYISEDELREYDEALEDLHVLMSQHKLRMKNLLKRAEGLFALIITIIPYLFGRAEQTLMVRLSEKAAQYGKSMKVITVLCMLYLPPSVLSSIFGMNFVRPTWTLRTALAIFISVTVGLAGLTIALWYLWEIFIFDAEGRGEGGVDKKPKLRAWRGWVRKSGAMDPEKGLSITTGGGVGILV